MFIKIVHCNTAIIKTHSHQVGEIFVDIYAHDAWECGEDEFWVCGVFKGVEEKHAMSLFGEII